MKKLNIKKMATVALLMALILVMQFLGGIIPPVGGFTISLVLIPIVLGAALYGPGVGALLGATFGTIVYVNCITGSDPGGAMVFQASPILCFLVVMGKGILAGWAAGAIYKLISRWNGFAAILCAAIVCPVVNTGVFVTGMLVFFKDVLSAWAGGGSILAYIFGGLALFNFLPELILNIVIAPASQTLIQVAKK